MTELMFSLGILYLMIMAIAIIVGGPKLIGKLNKFFINLFKDFFRWLLKLIRKFLSFLFNWFLKNQSLGISIIGVIVIIVCLTILF